MTGELQRREEVLVKGGVLAGWRERESCPVIQNY
jgi:hypothetical protein